MPNIRQGFIVLMFLAIFAFIFLNVNYDSNLGTIFPLIGLLAFGYYIYDKDHSITLTRAATGSSIKRALGVALLLGAISYAIFVLVSPLILNVFDLKTVSGSQFTTQSLIETFAAEQTKVLKGNTYIDYASFGIGVPFIETPAFFGVLFEFISDQLRTTISLFNPLTWAIILALALSFMFFHLQAKGIGNITSLVLVFIFALISLIVVLLERGMLGASILHILANSTSLGISLNLFASNLILPLVLSTGILGAILIFTSTDKRRIISFS